MPQKCLCRTTYTGARIPAIGLGIFGSDSFSSEVVAEAVKIAISIGYRHIDCAAVYGNENLIGQALRDVTTGNGARREELGITSKLWNNRITERHVNRLTMIKRTMYGRATLTCSAYGYLRPPNPIPLARKLTLNPIGPVWSKNLIHAGHGATQRGSSHG